MLFSRRKFMCGATATSLMIPSFMQLLSTKAEAANDTILVLVEMVGGNDGYNMIVPIDSVGYGRYQTLRPSLGISLKSVEAAGTGFDKNFRTGSQQATQYGMHPSLGAIQNPQAPNPKATNNLRALYGSGQVAFLTGIGIPEIAPARTNHVIAAHYQGTGQLTGNSVPGFGSRIVDQLGNPSFSLVSFAGDETPVSNPGVVRVDINGDLNSFNYASWGNGKHNPTQPGSAGFGITDLIDTTTNQLPSEAVRAIDSDAVGFIAKVNAYGTAKPATDYSTTIYDPAAGKVIGSSYKNQLKQVARLILAGAHGRVYLTSEYGFDTHGGQAGSQESLFAHVSESIAEFLQYLGKYNAASNVIVMTSSDFGRRPYENSHLGTDHGTSSVSILAGERVNGGLYGTHPTFTDASLDNDGNFAVTTDFRAKIAAVVRAFGLDPGLAMPDYNSSNDDPGLYEASEAALRTLFKA